MSPDNKKKILLIVDKPNWAYDSIAKSLLKFNNNQDLSLTIDYIKNPKIDLNDLSTNFDLFFFMGWQSAIYKNFFGNYKLKFPKIPKSKIICGIHSHHSWDNKKSLPELLVKPPKNLILTLNSLKAINLVSKRLYKIFISSGLKNAYLTYNGVDTQIFKRNKNDDLHKNLIIGYSGSKKHDWRKGISELIIPASKIEGVELKIAAPQISYVEHQNMSKFYDSIDLYICASKSEGFSLSVLEALASGIPIISTKVGGCEEIISNGNNGFLVDRNLNSIQDKIIYFKNNRSELRRMGNLARENILENWCWSIRSKDWYDFVRNSIL